MMKNEPKTRTVIFGSWRKTHPRLQILKPFRSNTVRDTTMRRGLLRTAYVVIACLLLVGLAVVLRQRALHTGKPAATPGPMLGQGFLNIETPDFTLSLVRSSQT